jgi:hypothetical protein
VKKHIPLGKHGLFDKLPDLLPCSAPTRPPPHSTQLKVTAQLDILGVKKNPNGQMYSQLGVLTK